MDNISIVTTNAIDYAPGETATITASGFDEGSAITFQVVHVSSSGADGIWGTSDDVIEETSGEGHESWQVVDGGEFDLDGMVNGGVVTSWYVHPDDSANARFLLTAISAVQSASTTFTDTVPVHTPVEADPTVANGTVFLAESAGATGSGYIDSFVRIQIVGKDGTSGAGIQDGYNSDATSELNAGATKIFNHAIQLADIPVVAIDGLNYRQFGLDLNELKSKDGEQISLTGLKIFSSGVSNLTDLSATKDSFASSSDFNLRYDMDGGGDLTVLLTAWNTGSGHGDYKVNILEENFNGLDGQTYIYLYSAWADADDGFEEWYVVSEDLVDPKPDISLSKTTTGVDQNDVLNTGDAISVKAGSNVTWTYTLTNTGNVGLDNIVLADDQIAALSQTHTGDTDDDNVLDVGETWIYQVAGVATVGDYVNEATVTANYGSLDLAASDQSSYFGYDPKFSLNKTTTGVDQNDVLNTGDAISVRAGSNVTWTYTLTNTGNVGFDNIVLADDQIAALSQTHTGDTDDDNVLDVGETWTYQVTGVAIVGDYVNEATVTANYGSLDLAASDQSSYFGYDPKFSLNKTTTGVDQNDVLNTGDAISVKAGSNVTWTYTLTNTGNVGLDNIVLADDQIAVLSQTHTGDTDDDNVLDVGETWTYQVAGVAIVGDYVNEATVTGNYGSLDLAASDQSSYLGTFTEAGAGRTQGFWGTHTEAWDGLTTNNAKWQKLVGTDLRAAEINPLSSGDVLLGDINHDGLMNGGETTLLVNKAVAQKILSSSVGGDNRISMLQQAIATQLNIDNGDVNPGKAWSPTNAGDKSAGDLITEAVLWLKSYGGSVFADGVLDSNDYNLSKASISSTTGYNKTTFWSTSMDVDGSAANVRATGEDLKNVLMAFNTNKLVTSSANQVGWNQNTTDPEHIVNATNVVLNEPDAFWLVAQNNITNFGLVWHG